MNGKEIRERKKINEGDVTACRSHVPSPELDQPDLMCIKDGTIGCEYASRWGKKLQIRSKGRDGVTVYVFSTGKEILLNPNYLVLIPATSPVSGIKKQSQSIMRPVAVPKMDKSSDAFNKTAEEGNEDEEGDEEQEPEDTSAVDADERTIDCDTADTIGDDFDQTPVEETDPAGTKGEYKESCEDHESRDEVGKVRPGDAVITKASSKPQDTGKNLVSGTPAATKATKKTAELLSKTPAVKIKKQTAVEASKKHSKVEASAVKKPTPKRGDSNKQFILNLLRKEVQTRDSLAKALIAAGMSKHKDPEKVKGYISVILNWLATKDGIEIERPGLGQYVVRK